MLINIGLGHLGWEILPGPMGPGPCSSSSSSSMGPGPRDPGPALRGSNGYEVSSDPVAAAGSSLILQQSVRSDTYLHNAGQS